jgi:uncharacterized membrane protein YccC
MTLDGISGAWMRHVVEEVGEIAREALARAERIERVDQALARQLARSMQENAKLQQRISMPTEPRPFSPALSPPVDRARSVLRRIDGRAHGVHHLWRSAVAYYAVG